MNLVRLEHVLTVEKVVLEGLIRTSDVPALREQRSCVRLLLHCREKLGVSAAASEVPCVRAFMWVGTCHWGCE